MHKIARPGDACKYPLAEVAKMVGLGDCSLVIRALEPGGASAEYRPEAPIYPASMLKVPLVAAALVEAAAGRLSLEDRFEVTEAHLTLNDAPSPLVMGATSQLCEIAHRAIAYSDNVATNLLFDIVGRERATQIVREAFGLAHTTFARKLSGGEPLIVDPAWDGVHRNAHPARDAARMFALVADGEVPHADLMMRALEAQWWNEKLSPGLRDGDRFAHKTGDTDEVAHDGGILTTAEGKCYVLVVYTEQEGTKQHNTRISEFMRVLRTYL